MSRCLALILMLVAGPALAISDDANPWLAIENAMCVRHRMVDYSALIGSPVHLETVEWTGAVDGLPTHCHLTGEVQGKPFNIRLPMTWNGQIVAEGCHAGEAATVVEALHNGAAVAFGPAAPRTPMLLAAVTTQHYGAQPSSKTALSCD